MKLQFEYFYGNEAEDFTFYRIPKKIITSPYFKYVSYGAKMLYGLLFDRVGLSIMNSWFDEENRALSARNHSATHLLQKALKTVLANIPLPYPY